MANMRYALGASVVTALLVLIAVYVYTTPTTRVFDIGYSTALFGGVSLSLGYATTTASLEKGLSGVKNIPNDYGMLFVFPSENYYGFWMKDMHFPLDIFWLDTQGHVVYMERNVATSTYPHVFYPTKPAQYVLETRAGFAKTHRIHIGTPLVLKSSSNVLK